MESMYFLQNKVLLNGVWKGSDQDVIAHEVLSLLARTQADVKQTLCFASWSPSKKIGRKEVDDVR